MTDLESFKAVRIQWHRALFASHLLIPSEEVLGAYLINVRLNWKTGQLNPAIATMAQDLSVDPRTIQRGINRLEHLGWFWTDRGTGRSRSSNYSVTDESIEIAEQVRSECCDEKDDSHVTLSIVKPWQERRERVTPLSHKRRQECHSNSKRKNHKNRGEFTKDRIATSALTIFVPGGGGVFEREWNSKLVSSGRAELDRYFREVRHEGRSGYWLPALWPATSGSRLLEEQLQQIDQAISARKQGKQA